MTNSFFSLLFRQKYITRWGLMKNTSPENLAEHATDVALLAHALCTIGNRVYGKNYDSDHAATLALFHDVPEVFTGDLPTPIKYYSEESKRNYAEIEEQYVSGMLSDLPEELRSEYTPIFTHENEDPDLLRLVKTADKLAAYIKCVEETNAGNRDFASALKSTEQALDRMKCPELEYFMERFLPAFGMTLDEMQVKK